MLYSITLDYSISTLKERIENKTIDLDPKFQRRNKWKIEQRSSLIESIILGIPIPPIFLSEQINGKYAVIDGKQRLTTISEFLGNRFKLKGLVVYSKLNGKSFNNLDTIVRHKLIDQGLIRAIIILNKTNKHFKFEVFTRLNTGGTTLNAQEIRNSTYPGLLNETIYDLTSNNDFRFLMGLNKQNYEKSTLYKDMRDAELVLRFLAFKDVELDNSYHSVKTKLDLYMNDNLDKSIEWILGEKEDFISTIKKTRQVYGRAAFKRWDDKKDDWYGKIISSLYEAQMIVCYKLTQEEANILQTKRQTIHRRMKKFTISEYYKMYYMAGTNQRGYVTARINGIKEILDNVLGG